ncbi:MAG: hypothetical protein PHD51_03725 [Patescibacteria group bacterium]|nr:hypothetical protein [Patescibacteria group bacterium]MDD5490920.1 hypothetical protein [Patescibacteria group bacterium]
MKKTQEVIEKDPGVPIEEIKLEKAKLNSGKAPDYDEAIKYLKEKLPKKIFAGNFFGPKTSFHDAEIIVKHFEKTGMIKQGSKPDK